METLRLRRDVPMNRCTTLELGGPARAIAECPGPSAVRQALELARQQHWSVAVLGGGSNLVVSDRGFDGLLVQVTDDRCVADLPSGHVRVGAGHDWDGLVAFAVAHRLAGIECLSGIPGRCGGAPIQNIGAYGQEVADRLVCVEAVEISSGNERRFAARECGFAYRESRFKREWTGRFCLTAIELELEPGGRCIPRYGELQRRLGREGTEDLARVRREVLALRRAKSMLADPEDPMHRSAGSFFTNPIVDEAVAAQAEEIGRASDADAPPLTRWPVTPGRVKLPAAWLIERTGLRRGYRRGPVGLSDHHALALVNLGGARTEDLLALAREVRDRVRDRFGITLRPEPVPLGFEDGEVDDLWAPTD